MKNYPLKIMMPAMFNKMAGRLSPVKVGLQLTKDCNLTCAHCYNPDEEHAESLSKEEIFSIIDTLKEMNISILALTGGEPMQRPELDEIIEHCTRRKLLTGLATNGTLIDEEAVIRHKAAGLDWYHLSFDSADEQSYDDLRGEGVSAKVKNTMRLAKKHGLDIIVTTVIMPANVDGLEEIVQELIHHSVKIWSPTIIIPCGRGKEYFNEEGFSKEQVRSVYETIFNLSEKYRKEINIYPMDSQIYYPYRFLKKKNIFTKMMSSFMGGCSVVKGTTLHIEHDGRVKPCAYFSGFVPDINVRDMPVDRIFRENGYLKALRDKSNLKGNCHDCEYLFCCGGCRSRALSMTGSAFSEDPYCFYK